MRDADRRYQVFISSTFQDLREERKQAVEVVLDAGHIPIALERFSPSNSADLAVIRKAIGASQIYILILGHRYGDIVPGRDISFTEFEYELALEAGLLILPLVLSDEEVRSRRSQLDDSKEADKAEMLNYERFEAFRHRLSQFRQLWDPTEQFKFLVLKALTDNLDEVTKPGFVRQADAPTSALLAHAANNAFIVDVVDELKGFERLYQRCLEKAEEKGALASFFRKQYLDLIVRNQVSLFFESGSTVVYVARELGLELGRVVHIDDAGRPNIQISSNNVLAHLQLWLRYRVPCTTFPWGPPSEQLFGASYGGLERIQERDPDYSLGALDELAKVEIDRLLRAPFSPPSRSPSLLLGAVSGLQMGTDHKLRFNEALDDEARADFQDQISRCFGPHVSSYHNKVFKRFMYATGLPIVIFITGDKIDCEIEVGVSHFILDGELTWESFCRDHPVAFCVACPHHEVNTYTAPFEALGFEILRSTDAAAVAAFVARNQRFIDTFERLQGNPRVLG